MFQSPQVKNSVKAFEFEGLAREIADIQDRVTAGHGLIERLEIETSESAVEAVKVEHRRTEAALKDVETHIKDIETRLSTEKLEVTREKQQAMAELLRRKDQALAVRTLLGNTERFLNETLPQLRREIGEINKMLKVLGIQQELSDLAYEDTGKLVGLRSTVESVLRDAIGKIEASERELKKYEAGMQEHAKQLNRKTELQGQLEQIVVRLKDLEEGAKRLQQLRGERSESFGRLLETILRQQEKYAELIAVFSSEKTEVLSDLDFVAELKLDGVSLLDGAQDVLDNRQVEVVASDRGKSVFEELLGLYARVVGGESDKIGHLVRETDRLAETLRPKVKRSQAISAGNLYRCLYGTYVTVVPVVTYKKTRLTKLSLGQKARC